jgi:methionyl-tRNA formyltransferase
VYFLGSGALLSRAVDYALGAGLAVHGVCCPPADVAIGRLRRHALAVLESADPNRDAAAAIRACPDGVVFSINNAHIIADDALRGGARFFNVHAGLIQQYRGIAEVCIFAALCRGERRYGVTLHQILPGQKVDCGPVVAQIEFEIAPLDAFADVLRRALDACFEIFRAHVRAIAANSQSTLPVAPAEQAYGYRDVGRLAAAADRACLGRAARLGPYAGFFPRLKSLIDTVPA